MHNVAHGTHCMQKNRFGVMFPGVLFVESYWSHLSKKIVCQRFVSQTHEMHYMTRRSHRMKNTHFAECVLTRSLWNPYRSHLSIKSNASMFHVPDRHECTTAPMERTACKKQVWCNVSRRAFCGILPVPPEHKK
jgi:hypothetical protein